MVLSEAPMRSANLRAFTALAGCCLLAGCATAPIQTTTYKPPETPRGIILVADGAGGAPMASEAIAAAVEKTRQPLFVRSINWSHGPGWVVPDVTDIDHSECEAKRFARLIAAYRDRFPNTPIYLVGYSAGAQVVLEATRSLGPDSVERIVLLAPAVAADYDLRPALAAARQGVDSFSSERDSIYLGIGTAILGTADGERGTQAAGRVGFDPPRLSPAEAHLANRLHEHPWDRSMVWTRNNGTHDGTLRPAYLRAYVLPLLSPTR
jgi:pimeloyl-ACP methyl ester carboxylesterase